MEARIYGKLQRYLTEKLNRGQTSFVPGMGRQVNLYRISERVRLKVSQKGRCYGFFIDFKSAYNTVLRDKLFKHLEGIFDTDEIEFIKGMYSRMQVTMGSLHLGLILESFRAP
jgi:hypothetical protein